MMCTWLLFFSRETSRGALLRDRDLSLGEGDCLWSGPAAQLERDGLDDLIGIHVPHDREHGVRRVRVGPVVRSQCLGFDLLHRLSRTDEREAIRVTREDLVLEELEVLCEQVVLASLERGETLGLDLLDLALVERGVQDYVCEQLQTLVERVQQELPCDSKAVATREPR